MTARRALQIALAALVAGCAAGPDYRRPEVAAPAAYKEAAGWKRAEPRELSPRGAWWEVFGDRELDALEAQVEVSNQNVLLAEAQVRQALALVRASRAPLFPSLSAGASVTRSRPPGGLAGDITTRNAELDLSWEVDLWGRVGRAVEASEAGAQASAADLAAARLSAQASLAQSYFQLRVLDVGRTLFEDTVAEYEKSLALTRNRYQAGVVGKSDVVQAETQLRSTQAQAVDLGVLRAQLEHAIASLIGKAPSEFAIERAPLAARVPQVPPGLPSELLERRPDVAAAERRVAAANAQIGVAEAAFFPSLTLPGVYGSSSLSAADWFTAPSRYWAIGPSIVLAIFDAGLRRAQTDQAIAAYDATVASYRQTVLTSVQEVEDNLAALRILEEEAKVQADAVRAAREAVALATNQYKAGTVSYLDVATLQAAKLNNERTEVVILGQRLGAAVQLIKALGGGWQGLAAQQGSASAGGPQN